MFFIFQPIFILILAAILPAIFLMYRIYRADRIEKEPPQLLFALFRQGIWATVIAIILESIGSWLLNSLQLTDQNLYRLIMYFIIVAGAEEGAKYYLLKRKTWNDPNFNYQFDAVVYAVFVSLGFALAENIAYVFMYGIGAALLRAVTAVPGHACFGVFMGTWYGIAKRYEKMGQANASRAGLILAFLVPALLHGAYNYIASLQDQSSWFFVAFVLLMFSAAYLLVNRLAKRDRSIG